MFETQYEALRRQGVSRRSFLQFCSLTAASLGLGSAGAQEIAQAIETKPRMPVVWLHGLECTCCTESFIRSYHPVAKDLVLSMISLDYDDTIMAAAGHQAEAALEETITKYKGLDPEVNMGGLAPGVDYRWSAYPHTRTTMIGLKVNF